MKKFRDLIKRDKPLNIIHGTDRWTDCDDCMALRLLCRAHNEGVINLLGIGINAVMEYSAPSVSAMLTSEGVDGVSIGVDYNAVDTGERCRYQYLLKDYPHKVKSNSECEEAYKMYRRLLSYCEGKADITEVGFPQIIMDLLKSEPDEYSPLSGKELVKEKVNKIWMMAGRWDMEDGAEYNLVNTVRSREAGAYICENSPVPVTFLGFEIGEKVLTGGKILDEDDILYKAMEIHGSANGRDSWDPMLTLMAIINDEKEAGYSRVVGNARVDAMTGKNNFTPCDGGKHCYVIKDFDDAYYIDMINSLIASK